MISDNCLDCLVVWLDLFWLLNWFDDRFDTFVLSYLLNYVVLCHINFMVLSFYLISMISALFIDSCWACFWFAYFGFVGFHFAVFGFVFWLAYDRLLNVLVLFWLILSVVLSVCQLVWSILVPLDWFYWLTSMTLWTWFGGFFEFWLMFWLSWLDNLLLCQHIDLFMTVVIWVSCLTLALLVWIHCLVVCST